MEKLKKINAAAARVLVCQIVFYKPKRPRTNGSQRTKSALKMTAGR